MSDKLKTVKAAQSSDKLPTLQERIGALAEQLIGIKGSVTPDELAKASKKAGISTRTGERYLDGKIGFLHRGQTLYSELLKYVKSAA